MEKDFYLFQRDERYERSGCFVQLTKAEAAQINKRLRALEEEGLSRSPWVLYPISLGDKKAIKGQIAHVEQRRREERRKSVTANTDRRRRDDRTLTMFPAVVP